MRSLLDINVVIALLDPDHLFHHRAHTWWGRSGGEGWASCPITENGVVRIMSNRSYNPKRSLSPNDAAAILRTFTERTDHQFWQDTVSILDPTFVDSTRLLGPKQVTDTYLLALASINMGRLVTFDESIYRQTVPGAGEDTLHVI